MPWKLIDRVMIVLSFAAVIAVFMPWWQPGHPLMFAFQMMLFVWNITLLRRREHVPYPSQQGEHFRGR